MRVDSAHAVGRGFGWFGFVVWNGVVASLLGAVAVVLVLGLNFAVLALWLGLLVSSARKQLRQRRPRLAATGVTIQMVVIGLVVTAAHVAPGKTTDRYLDCTITIPNSRMTLGELGGDPQGPHPEWRPFSLSISVPDDEMTNEIVFPETTITLREFVDAVETQSTLRHRFAHCGNGWTILWGGDCSFGLHLRRP
jgi:hypothetical protein